MKTLRRPLVAGTLYLLVLTFATAERADARTTLATYALAVFFGLVVGAIGDVLSRGRRLSVLRAWTLVAIVHAFFVAFSIADQPALWSDLLYARGGVPRTVEVLAAHTFGKPGIVIVAAIAAVLYARPAAVVRRVRRLLPISLALLVSCSSHHKKSSADDIVVIVVPALRADQLDAMPALSRFAREGAVRFDRAYVSRFDPAPVYVIPGRPSAVVTRGNVRPRVRAAALWPVAGVLEGRERLPRGPGSHLLTVVVDPRDARGDDRYRGRYAYTLPERVSTPDADDKRQLRLLQADYVANVDRAIARVLAEIDLEHTVVVVTALRGQSLFERDRGWEPSLLGDESTHVPLVFYDPRTKAARREGALVRDVDLVATLHELATIPLPQEGRSLLHEPLEPRSVFAEAAHWSTEDMPALETDPAIADLARPRMVREGRWKLVYVPRRNGVQSFLFDTEADPDEVVDHAADYPPIVKRLQGELFAWATRDGRLEVRGDYLVPRDEKARR